MQVVKNGMGLMVPGAFVVPQNPIVRSLGNLIGPASFAVPQNPLLGNTTIQSGTVTLTPPKKNALKASLKGLSCGACASGVGNGMGSLDPTNLFNGTETFADYFMDTSAFTIPNWTLIVAIPLLLLEVFKRHRSGGGGGSKSFK